MRERLYLDTCVLNRPSDDQTQLRVREETAAIAAILDLVAAGETIWLTSRAVHEEITGNPSMRKREDTLQLLGLASECAGPDAAVGLRAEALHGEGFGVFDALHLAFAEAAKATTLLTVDDRFLRRAGQRPEGSHPTVENPIDWLRRRKPWLIKR